MLYSDRALAEAEALFKKNGESTEAVDESPADGSPARRRRRIVRQVQAEPEVDSTQGPGAGRRDDDPRRSAREILRLLKRKEAPRSDVEEIAPPPPIVRPRRRIAQPSPTPAPAPASTVFQLEVEVLGDDPAQPETIILVVRGTDMAHALRSTVARVEAWMDDRKPGAEWRMTAIELLPDLLV